MFELDFKMLGKKNIVAFIDKKIDDKQIGEFADAYLKSIPLEGNETANIAVAAIYNDGKMYISIYGAYHSEGSYYLTKPKETYSFKNFLKKIISYAK